MGKQTWKWVAAVLLLATGAVAGDADAQIFTPSFLGPRTSSDFGVYLSDGPGELAVEGIWRRGFGGYDLGFRAGIADTDDLSLLLGGDLRSPLAAAAAPVDLALTAGIQALVGDRTGLGAQLGVSLGYTFVPGTFSLSPYIHPRIGVVDRARGSGDADLDLLADLGVDFGFSPNLMLRIGVGFAQPGAGLGIGLAWR